MNPNDSTAELYDIIYAPFFDRTEKEVEFVLEHIEGSPILDLGCGTGRHAIPLMNAGRKVICVESSSEMVRVLKDKLDGHSAKIIQSDALRASLPRIAGAIIFWNAFGEMARTEDAAKRLVAKLHEKLACGGTLIVEQTNPETLDLAHAVWQWDIEREEGTYKCSYSILGFEQGTTRACERIELVRDRNVQGSWESVLEQRWWTREELERIVKDEGFAKIDFYGGDFKAFCPRSERFILVAAKDT